MRLGRQVRTDCSRHPGGQSRERPFGTAFLQAETCVKRNRAGSGLHERERSGDQCLSVRTGMNGDTTRAALDNSLGTAKK